MAGGGVVVVRSTVARWCAALALAVLFAPLGLLVGAAAHAEPADAAVSRFASCVAGQKSGQVLFLIDESLSLQKSDPKAARVAAANTRWPASARCSREISRIRAAEVAGSGRSH